MADKKKREPNAFERLIEQPKPKGPPAPPRQAKPAAPRNALGQQPPKFVEDIQRRAGFQGPQARRNQQAVDRAAATGDMRTLTQRALANPNTYESRVAQARKQLGIKPGTPDDELLKSALYLRIDNTGWEGRDQDGLLRIVPAESVREITRRMRNPKERQQLQAEVEARRAMREGVTPSQIRPATPEEAANMARRGQVSASEDALRASGAAQTRENIDRIAGEFTRPIMDALGTPIGRLAAGAFGALPREAQESAVNLANEALNPLVFAPRTLQYGQELLSGGPVLPETRAGAAVGLAGSALAAVGYVKGLGAMFSRIAGAGADAGQIARTTEGARAMVDDLVRSGASPTEAVQAVQAIRRATPEELQGMVDQLVRPLPGYDEAVEGAIPLGRMQQEEAARRIIRPMEGYDETPGQAIDIAARQADEPNQVQNVPQISAKNLTQQAQQAPATPASLAEAAPAPQAPQTPDLPPSRAIPEQAAGQKEPWAMTRNEWDAAKNQLRPNDQGTGGDTQGGMGRTTSERGMRKRVEWLRREQSRLNYGLRPTYTVYGPDGSPQIVTERPPWPKGELTPDWDERPVGHIDVVQKALQEGKPVPPEVLADYPDLAAKYGNQPNAIQEPQTAGSVLRQAGRSQEAGQEAQVGLREVRQGQAEEVAQAAPTAPAPAAPPKPKAPAPPKPPKPPAQKPKAVTPPPQEPNLIGFRHQDIEPRLKEAGIDPVAIERLGDAGMRKAAAEGGYVSRAGEIARRIVESRKGAVDAKEVLGMQMRRLDISVRQRALDKAIREAGDDVNKLIEIDEELAALGREIVDIDQAVRLSTSEAGRTLREAQMVVDETLDQVGIRNRWRGAARGDLPANVEAQVAVRAEAIAKAEEELSAAQSALSKLEKENADLRAKIKMAEADAALKGKNTPSRPRALKELEAKAASDFESWKKKFAKAGVKGGKQRGAALDPALLAEGAYLYSKMMLVKGVRKLDDIIRGAKEEGIELSREEMARAVERAADDLKPARKPALKATMADLRAEIAQAMGRDKAAELMRAARRQIREEEIAKAREAAALRREGVTATRRAQSEARASRRASIADAIRQARSEQASALRQVREEQAKEAAALRRESAAATRRAEAEARAARRQDFREAIRVSRREAFTQKLTDLSRRLSDDLTPAQVDAIQQELTDAANEFYGRTGTRAQKPASPVASDVASVREALRDAKRQARLVQALEEAERLDTQLTRATTQEELDAIRDKLNKLGREIGPGKNFADDGGAITVRRRNPETGKMETMEVPQLQEARAKVRMARAKLDRERTKVKQVQELLRRKADFNEKKGFERTKSLVMEGLGTLKAFNLSADLGMFWRQGGIPLVTRPKKVGRAFNSLKQSITEAGYDKVMATIANSPYYDRAIDAGLKVGLEKEEDFMFNIFDILDKGKGGATDALNRYVKFNDRTYTAAVHQMRMDLFEELGSLIERTGDMTQAEAKALADFINDMTGASSLGSLDRHVPLMNQLLISARYYTSRIKMLTSNLGAVLGTRPGLPPRVRAIMAREYGRYLSTIASVGLLTHMFSHQFQKPQLQERERLLKSLRQAKGAQKKQIQDRLALLNDEIWAMQFDPRGSGSMTVKVGPVRIDPPGGLRPFVNFFTRAGLSLGQSMIGLEGKERMPNFVTTAGREVSDADYNSFSTMDRLVMSFFLIRSNPAPRILLSDYAQGPLFDKPTFGMPMLEDAARTFFPLAATIPLDTAAAKQGTLGERAGAGGISLLINFFGLGNYEISEKEKQAVRAQKDLEKKREKQREELRNPGN